MLRFWYGNQNYYPCNRPKHSLTPESNEVIYRFFEFFEHFLKGEEPKLTK